MVENGDKKTESAIEKANRLVRVRAWDDYREARNRATEVYHRAILEANSVRREDVAQAWATYKVIVDGAKTIGDLLEQAIEVMDDK